MLYVREEMLERLWVNTATSGWRDYQLKAYRFSNLGTSNLSVIVGLKAALDFFQAIGPSHIYARLHALAKRVRDRIAEHKQLRLANASADAFYGGLVSFEPVTGDLKKVTAECNARHIRLISGPQRIRVATHLFTQPPELQALFDAVEKGLRV